MVEWLTEPWQYEFMQRALWAGLLVSAAGAVVGAFVVVKGLAFMSDAVAHSSLAGAAVAFVAGGSSVAISLGAVVAAVVTAIGVSIITRTSRLREDTAIGLLFAGFFGFAVLLISSSRSYALDLNSFIVGNILGVGQSDLVLMGILTALVLALTFVFYRELLFTSYDPVMAAASGVPVNLVHMGLLSLVAVAAVIAFRLVGVVLVMAMLVAPAASAALLVRRMPVIMALGAVAGVVSTVSGLYISFHADLAAGPAIVIVAILIFVATYVLADRGLGVPRRLRRRPDTTTGFPMNGNSLR
jgi:manganese/iron transport system permease protein